MAAQEEGNLKGEYLLPTIIGDLLKEGKSDAEKAQIDRTVNMAASMLKKKA